MHFIITVGWGWLKLGEVGWSWLKVVEGGWGWEKQIAHPKKQSLNMLNKIKISGFKENNG